MIRFSAKSNIALSIISALLIAFEIARLFQRRLLVWRPFVQGLAAWLTIILIAAVLAVLLQRVLHLTGGLPVNWIAHPLPVKLAFWSLAASIVITSAVLFARVCGFWPLWSGVWAAWAALSVVVAWWMPGVSYVLTIPTAVAAFQNFLERCALISSTKSPERRGS